MRLVFSKFIAFLQLIRVFMATTLGLSAVAGAHLANSKHDGKLFVTLFLAGFLTGGAGFACNDIQDMDRDFRVPSKPLARKALSVQFAAVITTVMFAAACAASLCLSVSCLCITICHAFMLMSYSAVKKRNGILANAMTALLCASGIVYGAMSGEVNISTIWIALSCLLFVFGREILKDIADRDTDSMAFLRTIPTKLSGRASGWVSLCFTIAGSCLCVGTVVSLGKYAIGVMVTPLLLISIAATIITALQERPAPLRIALDSSALAMLVLVLVLSSPPS